MVFMPVFMFLECCQVFLPSLPQFRGPIGRVFPPGHYVGYLDGSSDIMNAATSGELSKPVFPADLPFRAGISRDFALNSGADFFHLFFQLVRREARNRVIGVLDRNRRPGMSTTDRKTGRPKHCAENISPSTRKHNFFKQLHSPSFLRR